MTTYPQDAKKYKKSDFLYLLGPILGLAIFIGIAVLAFPKPSRIYRGGVLKECECAGLIATPKGTNAIGVGDSYCLGIPHTCKELQIIKDKDNE